MKITGWLKSEKHRQLVERWWIVIVLAWDIFKTIVVDETFAKYGVNPYIYFVIVVVIAVPYAKSTAKMLFAILANHWSNAFKFGLIAVVLHFVPDIYILVTAKHVPRSLFDSFLVAIVIFTVFAVHGIVSHIRAEKKN
ncbi:MAG: hypothetical protein ACKOVI_00695 [Candidatus Planktophila sp.]